MAQVEDECALPAVLDVCALPAVLDVWAQAHLVEKTHGDGH